MSEQKYIKIEMRFDCWRTILVPVPDIDHEFLAGLDQPLEGDKDEYQHEQAADLVGTIYSRWEGMSEDERAERCFVIAEESCDFGFEVAKDNRSYDVSTREADETLGLIPTEEELAITRHERLRALRIEDLRSIESDTSENQSRTKRMLEALAADGRSMLPEDPDQAIELLLRTLKLTRRFY
jgi:hypothetical protein